MTGIITIVGQIGSYEKKGKFVKGAELIDVITEVQKLPAETDVLEIRIAGPGGLVETGDAIYNYLESLKKKYKAVNTVQVGHLASISTKIWAVGQDRKRDPRYEFMIHNPWGSLGEGDSKELTERLEGLIKIEQGLRKFYMDLTGLSEEALEPLMDDETFLSAQQCLDLKFATSLTSIPIMAEKKDDKKLSFSQRVAAIMAAIKGDDAPKALELKLADGSMITSDATDMAGLVGSALTRDGQPMPDGDYPLDDGSTLSVAGGKATKLTPKTEDSTGLATTVTAIRADLDKLAQVVGEFVQAQTKAAGATAIQAAVKELETKVIGTINEKESALRKEIGTTHEPKKKQVVYAETVAKDQSGHKTIPERLQEIAARKKSA